MRIHNTVIVLVTAVFALLLVSGTAMTEQYPQAARAQSVGFDALAHNLFDVNGAPAAGGRK